MSKAPHRPTSDKPKLPHARTHARHTLPEEDRGLVITVLRHGLELAESLF